MRNLSLEEPNIGNPRSTLLNEVLISKQIEIDSQIREGHQLCAKQGMKPSQLFQFKI